MDAFETLTGAPEGRFDRIARVYDTQEVKRLGGSLHIENTLARRAAEKLWHLLQMEDYVHCLGAMTGCQAMQMARAGLKAIYLSGWQVAADANTAGAMYPDQSLYPANSGPELARRINATLRRADEIEHAEGEAERDWFLPIVADAESGFGGALNAFEITRAYIEAGVGGLHFEDQLASEKKCGHMGGKVLIPTRQHIENLNAARMAADIARIPTVIIARTDAESARLITSDIDERDRPHLTGERTPEGFHVLKPETAFERCIERGRAYAPYSDLIWMETSTPDIDQARRFAEAIHAEFPDKMLAYNCSPSFNWSSKLSAQEIEDFQRTLGAMGYKFQFITLAGFHALNLDMFQLAHDYRDRGMSAYVEIQEAEFQAASKGYTAHRHQREVGAGWFDALSVAVKGGASSTTALADSTESDQFKETFLRVVHAAE